MKTQRRLPTPGGLAMVLMALAVLVPGDAVAPVYQGWMEDNDFPGCEAAAGP